MSRILRVLKSGKLTKFTNLTPPLLPPDAGEFNHKTFSYERGKFIFILNLEEQAKFEEIGN